MALLHWRSMGVRRSIALLLLAAAMACGPSAQEREARKQEIRQDLEAYLARLAEAYASGDAEMLGGLAVKKEVASVAKLIGDLANQGLAYRPRLKQLTLEGVTVWREVNATATTLEVWDIDKVVLGSERVLSQVRDQPHRVRYLLKRREGSWQVLYRQVDPGGG